MKKVRMFVLAATLLVVGIGATACEQGEGEPVVINPIGAVASTPLSNVA
ncbi:MAG: hypothetical protein KDC73_11275 [Ignavibacteriae bacterium]|nr:hypothetical protein [Ignavibacteriota bacterium]MCB0725271.1 hypothetical protein [Ignavibacteriota bacterium]